MNHRMIRYIISMFLRAEAAFMVLPIFLCLCFRDYHDIMPFVYSIGLTLLAAVVLGIKKPKNDVVFARESFISVSLGWLLLSFFGAICLHLKVAVRNACELTGWISFRFSMQHKRKGIRTV